MFCLLLTPYFFVFTTASVWVMLSLYFMVGLGVAGIGLSVMHDANHGSYAKSPLINRIIGYSLNVIGGNATNWKIQHNIFHHTYTNIDTHDEDIRPRFVLRFTPHGQLRSFHRFQHIYAWFLYGLMSISWIIFKDFAQFSQYQKTGMLEKQVGLVKGWSWLILTKLVYYAYIIVIPIMFTPFAWWQIFIGFFVMHYIAGFILGVVFQAAHVMPTNEYPVVNEDNNIDENWMVHQLKTTSNFAGTNFIFSWFVGGLNYQVEHHLYPNICHVHYSKLAPIVEKTAREFNIPYHNFGSFRNALYHHGKMLYTLGRQEKELRLA
jgi:linoleoyl-CoA desaturase